MRILKLTVLVLTVLLIIGGLFAAHIFLRLDLMFNPIVQEINTDTTVEKWGDRVQLIPDQFETDQDRASVLQKLKHFGFTRTADSEVWLRYQYEIDKGRQIYQREGDVWYCNIQYYVFLEFNAQNKLIFAQGASHELGCL
jgi:hypothetical protein